MKKVLIGFMVGIYLSGISWASDDLRKGLKEVQSFLDAGLAAYKAGKINEAEGNFSDAYFVAFEASGLETAIRQKISSKRAFQLERLFHNLRRMALGKAEVRALEAEVERTIREISLEVVKLESPGQNPWLRSPLRAFLLLASPLILIIAGLGVFWWLWRKGVEKGI